MSINSQEPESFTGTSVRCPPVNFSGSCRREKTFCRGVVSESPTGVLSHLARLFSLSVPSRGVLGTPFWPRVHATMSAQSAESKGGTGGQEGADAGKKEQCGLGNPSTCALYRGGRGAGEGPSWGKQKNFQRKESWPCKKPQLTTEEKRLSQSKKPHIVPVVMQSQAHACIPLTKEGAGNEAKANAMFSSIL